MPDFVKQGDLLQDQARYVETMSIYATAILHDAAQSLYVNLDFSVGKTTRNYYLHSPRPTPEDYNRHHPFAFTLDTVIQRPKFEGVEMLLSVRVLTTYS